MCWSSRACARGWRLLVGGSAAVLAYLVGVWLKQLTGT